jgi:hypothetical protein
VGPDDGLIDWDWSARPFFFSDHKKRGGQLLGANAWLARVLPGGFSMGAAFVLGGLIGLEEGSGIPDKDETTRSRTRTNV